MFHLHEFYWVLRLLLKLMLLLKFGSILNGVNILIFHEPSSIVCCGLSDYSSFILIFNSIAFHIHLVTWGFCLFFVWLSSERVSSCKRKSLGFNRPWIMMTGLFQIPNGWVLYDRLRLNKVSPKIIRRFIVSVISIVCRRGPSSSIYLFA